MKIDKQPHSQESWTATWIKRIESDAVWLVTAVHDSGIGFQVTDLTWHELMEEWECSDSMHGPFHPCYR